MLIFGFISIIQISIIPGLLFVYLFEIKTTSKIQEWLYIFSFSLFLNYVLVTILTLISLYSIIALWVILILELFLFLIFRKGILRRFFPILNFREAILRLKIFIKSISFVNKFLIIASGIIILFYFALFIANIGTIFYFIDTVNNYEWNSWAIDFANNILPKYSSHFPQLIPANWSISYVLIGTMDVHFFPKFIMPLFFISNLLIFLDLALEKNHNIFLLGLIIYGLFAPIVFSLVFIADGNADLPVSFFTFMTFYALVKFSPGSSEKHFISFPEVNPENKTETINNYLLVFLFASMAAATKLAGAYVFTITSLMLLSVLLWRRKAFTRRDIMRILMFVLAMVVLSLFWYLRSPKVMTSGLNQPQYLSPEGYPTIFVNALKLIYYNWGLPVCTFFVLTIFASILDRRVRYISIIMVITPIVIWMFKYSVDFRNLSFVIPFLSFSSAAGLSIILGKFNIKQKIRLNEVNNTERINDSDFVPGKSKTLFLTLFSALIFLIWALSDKFYLLLYNIYNFVYKYYFLNHRITHFTEYDYLLHVDFYQRTFIALSIIIAISSILILLKIRLRTLVILTILALISLNFTIIKKDAILKHQSEAFLNVDARNHYQLIKTIMGNKKSSVSVYTNFKNILKDKIERKIKFKYEQKITIPSLSKMEKLKPYLLIQTDKLNEETSNYIKNNIDSGKYNLLLDDNRYLFFVVNPG